MSLIQLREPLAPLVVDSLADRVADKIVDAIALGRLRSGDRLNEQELADAFGVSRVPVREASRILSSQGIAEAAPRRGVRVAAFDADWATNLHNVRVAIERLAARSIAGRLKDEPALVEPLRSAAESIREAVARRPVDAYEVNRADIAFHAEVFRLADSPFLSTLWSAIARHVLIMFAAETYRRTNFQQVAEQHDDYIAALLSGSLERLDSEIEVHVAGVELLPEERLQASQ